MLVVGDDQLVGAQCGGALELGFAPSHRDHAAAVQLRQFNEHQTDGPQADDGDIVAVPWSGLLEAANHASQRLDQRGVVISDCGGNAVRVLLDDAGRNPDIFRVGAVVEQQVFAEILQTAAAEKTFIARRGIRCDYPIANRKLRDTLANRDYVPGQFVPKHSGWNDHAGMIAAAKDLNIGSARQRYFHPDEDVSVFDCRNGDRLYLQVFLAIKHGSHHLVIHYAHLCG